MPISVAVRQSDNPIRPRLRRHSLLQILRHHPLQRRRQHRRIQHALLRQIRRLKQPHNRRFHFLIRQPSIPIRVHRIHESHSGHRMRRPLRQCPLRIAKIRLEPNRISLHLKSNPLRPRIHKRPKIRRNRPVTNCRLRRRISHALRIARRFVRRTHHPLHQFPSLMQPLRIEELRRAAAYCGTFNNRSIRML